MIKRIARWILRSEIETKILSPAKIMMLLKHIFYQNDDEKNAAAARRALILSGTHLTRVTVWVRAPETPLPYPSYFADLIVSESAATGGPLPSDLKSLTR